MPTGYTAGILDGKITTFSQFVKQSMRAFGACNHMVDMNFEEDYIERSPSSFYKTKIKELEGVIEQISLLTDAEILENKKKELEEKKRDILEQIKKKEKYTNVLMEILKEAKEWEPPTEEHVGIKSFMIDQLESTIKYDCDLLYEKNKLKKVQAELENFPNFELVTEERTKRIEKAKTDIEDYTKEYEKEIKRCQEANQWVKELLGSLEPRNKKK